MSYLSTLAALKLDVKKKEAGRHKYLTVNQAGDPTIVRHERGRLAPFTTNL
ncbi:hypothetical protein KYK27_05320 [Pontibacter populi]|uniref:Arm DNA-binding domain-containing protein n=1 Tax=Pontibacter populi TaxID=890055 RepID=A0ABS6X9A9_9BACT|nr:hypothetical protein [Pontibacter populi]